MPAGVLESACSYVFVVTAISDPSIDSSQTPFLAAVPYASASALTGALTP